MGDKATLAAAIWFVLFSMCNEGRVFGADPLSGAAPIVAAALGSCSDGDGDGYGSPGDPSCPNGAAEDCDDGDPDVNPGEIEICGDQIDQDCDGVGGVGNEGDEDADGLTNAYERASNPSVTDVCDQDTDNDGLSDFAETTLSTDPADADYDDDGLSDGEEVNIYGTNPQNPDSDDDWLSDGLEMGRGPGDAIPGGMSDGTYAPARVAYSGTDGSWVGDSNTGTTTDPLDSDTDNDGLDENAEDTDYDGDQDWDETNPWDADTDDDGLSDGFEDGTSGTDPLDPDSDGDILTDGLEMGRTSGVPGGTSDGPPAVNVAYAGTAGEWTPDSDGSTTTDPLDEDSDDDGLLDGEEDANANGRVDLGETDPNMADCNGNGIPDECDLDCGPDGGPCDVEGCGGSDDCNANGVPDECDLIDGVLHDTNTDGVPDECGACCHGGGCEQVIQATCDTFGKYRGDMTTCEEECPGGIPTVSEWGLVAMTLLVLAAGTLVLRRPREAPV